MRRVLIRRPGGHDALKLVEEADPVPGPGEALVRVAACGVNFADCAARMGLYEAAKGISPLTPGFEFAGVVESLGPGASAFKPGDRVLGITRFGAYQDVLAAGQDRLWPCPEGWTLEAAAGFPAVHLTAWYGLHETARVRAGETLLVHSAAGGAGGAFAALGRLAGCRVVGVVGSGAKVPAAAAVCDAVIDRSSQDLWREAERLAPGGYDAIFDANGVSTARAGYERLAPGGRLVVYGFADMLARGGQRPPWPRLALQWLRLPRFNPLHMTARNRGVLGFNVAFLFHKLPLARSAMRTMLAWAAEGKLKAPSVTVFPLAEAGRAHAALESGRTTGKLVLAP